MKRLTVTVAFVVALASGATARAQEAATGGAIDGGKLTKVPRQTRFVDAEYPREAVARGVEADVVLALDVGADGNVESASVIEPAAAAGFGFDEAALAAALQFEFEPAEIDGHKIAVQLSYRYKFRLQRAAAPPAAPPPAPVVNLAGVLRERGTRLPLAGVLVTVFRDGDGVRPPVGFEATSDAAGAFQFVDLAPGTWKVAIDAPGYLPYSTTETTRPGERVDVVYYVERNAYNPYDVTVTGDRPRKEVSRTAITAAELDKVPGTFGDPLAVIQNFAGVARPPPLTGQLIIRGSAPQDSQVFVDGTQIPLVYHFGGLRTVLPVAVVDSLELVPGNFAADYGRATGGIVNVATKQLRPSRIGGYVDVNVFDAGVYVEAPIGDKAAVAIAARRSYVDLILDAVVPANAPVNLITAPRYYDYQLLASWRPAPAHDLRLFVFGSDDGLALLFKNPGALAAQSSNNAASFATTFHRAVATYNFVPGGALESATRLALGNDHVGFGFGPITFRVDTDRVQLRETLRWRAARWLTLIGGADVLVTRAGVHVTAPLPPKEGQPPMMIPPDVSMLRTTDRRGVDEWSPAVFVEAELAPAPSLLVLPGLRVDRFGAVGETVAEPRLTARWRLTDRLTLKGGAGVYAQEPAPDETDPAFGNPALRAERALHYSGGAEFRLRPSLTFDGTVFYKDIRDLVSATSATVTDASGVTRPLTYDNGGRGRVVGLELVARCELTKGLSGWIAYTLSRATRRDSGATADRLFDFDQTHILTVVGSYALPHNWQVGARFRFVTGDPITPVTGAVYNATLDRYTPTYGAVNAGRLPPFHQLDVRIDKRWIHDRWILDAYLDVQNAYNRSNVDAFDYDFNYRRSSPQQGLPILPILGVRADL